MCRTYRSHSHLVPYVSPIKLFHLNRSYLPSAPLRQVPRTQSTPPTVCIQHGSNHAKVKTQYSTIHQQYYYCYYYPRGPCNSNQPGNQQP
jgi:hypothetical protein